MKKLTLTLAIVLVAITTILAQVPQSFKYQAVVRDDEGGIQKNKLVSFRISILSDSPLGNTVYEETHYQYATNEFGIVTLNIGEGTVVSGDFSTIDWGTTTYYVKTELDINGGSNYEFIGTSQLLSVPYSFYAENATNINDADADSTNEIQAISLSNDTLYLSNGGSVYMGNYNDADANPTNEIQAISLSNDTLYLSNGGNVYIGDYMDNTDSQTLTLINDTALSISNGNTIQLTAGVADADADPTNELQLLSISNDTLYLSNGNYVVLPPDADTDSTNELQILLLSNDTLYLSDGNYIVLSDNDPTNELQTLSLSNDTLNISNGNSVILTDIDPTNELQTLTLSGDTLFIGSGNYVILNWHSLYNSSFVCGDILFDFRVGQITSYTTVLIGTQCWMAENLNIGTKIDGINDQTDNSTIDKYCYNNLEINCDIYGGLYQWDEMMQYNPSDTGTIGTTQGVCPMGWHIPTDEEWKTLEMYLGMSQFDADSVGWRGTDEGGKLKETGTTHWQSPNTGATNESDFTALPGGYRMVSGLFTTLGLAADFWSATKNSPGQGWQRYLYNTNTEVYRYPPSKIEGLSVRCVKD